ncbi:piwi-like protein 1 [Ictalurus furcatus]|uniref:piwi-like protein 1 n=1 Tax=Ictalurus furcatus TaxID=66913 RepID=UPI00234FC3B7|nr:piwi-like protein 1 [Ictalurus furcatus]XP_053475777.1 piwi-like protein 1 [Ictalurus furcatus]
MTIAPKISLQMNCKMEGEPWSVEIPLKHLMMLVSTATTTVPQERDPSVHWWPASTRACPAVLKVYFKYNECLPSRMVVYRDGVGDGVLLSVVDYEVPQFTQSTKAMGEDSAPKLTVLVVKKRISSRFFALLDARLSNPPPGTVIDAEVT